VTPEPQPELYFLPPARHFVVPPLEHPAAFIEEVEEADIIDDTFALVVFHRPPFVDFVVPPLGHPAAFIEEVEEVDVIDDALALVLFHRPPFVENEPPVVNAPPVSSLKLFLFCLSRH